MLIKQVCENMKSLLKTILFCICFTQVYSQSLEEDLNAVRAICDSNGLSGINIYNFIEIENDRVVSLIMEANLVVDIHVIPADLGRLTALKKLVLLDFFGLEALPPEIGNLKALDSLVVEGCRLKELPKEIGNCLSLINLKIHDNVLTEIPADIGHLSLLLDIDLGRNLLTEIPSEFGNLTSLESLSLFNNQLTTLPEEIGNISSLCNIIICNNNLESLPVSIGNLKSLTTLNIINNNLTFLPDGICTLLKLKSLLFQGNKLSTLPDSIGNLVSITTLDGSCNMIKSIPASITNINLPQGPDGVNLCFNPDLVFTTEQQIWTGAKDYAEYEDKYCDVGIEEFSEKECKSTGNVISVLHGTLLFQVSVSGQVRLEVYDIQGKRLKILINDYYKKGKYSIHWKAKVSGVYFIKLIDGQSTKIKKVTVTK